ncbi:MAG TPA: TPM domain-containing protein [Vicinamibacterales bacterium]|nr:TPM domain-containing protein [Acidobacteriota bacterium]HQX80505.1 TPM domain-containing protein [Vicinamibacterales bacterium]
MTPACAAVRRLALVAACFFFIFSPAAAQAQGPLPTLTAPVNDFANVIDAGSAAELDRIIRVLQTTTGDVVVVATIDTFAPYATIEEYATRLFEKAGIGTRKADSGVLMLVAVQDRRVRIEVGYGIEEFITDGFAGDTIRTQMLPAFREGGYGPGLVAGATRVITRIAQGRGVTLPNVVAAARPRSEPNGGIPIGVVILFLVLFSLMGRFGGFGGLGGIAALLLQNRRGRRSTWSGWHGGSGGFGGGFGGGGGGGFGGFGGGRSGGGGASGGW